jgi:hypothetical protein
MIYSSKSLRSEVEEEFKELCHKELEDFYKLIKITGEINSFLIEINNNIDSKEYYARIINARIRDHMICATLLIGKGYLVDGITLVRSSLEDLWVIQNIYYSKEYFEKWKKGGKVEPSKLRGIPELKDRKKDNENIYYNLCNISHCNIRSLEYMSSFHPSIVNENSEGILNVVKNFQILLFSFYGNYLQLIELFEVIYDKSSKADNLNSIKQDLFQLDSPL